MVHEDGAWRSQAPRWPRPRAVAERIEHLFIYVENDDRVMLAHVAQQDLATTKYGG